MSDTIYSISTIQSILQPIFHAHHIKKAILFGSYAKGNAKKNSDVDILVDSGLKGLAFFGLLEDVVTALDKNVDMLDTSQIIQDSLVDKEIKQSGVLIYGQ
ncbi:MAG: nucleotidyltransferase domain-containing protein [Ruminococcus sp.]|nr:nucleotidyltransferase domain-containing protein [Ruminococcus sp.]